MGVAGELSIMTSWPIPGVGVARGKYWLPIRPRDEAPKLILLTETTPISHGLTHELSQCSFTQLPTTAQRAFHTHSQTLILILNVRLKRSLNSFS